MSKAKVDIEFNKNEDTLKLAVSNYQRKLETIMLGGGQKRLDKLKEKGKLGGQNKVPRLSNNRSLIEQFLALNASLQTQP